MYVQSSALVQELRKTLVEIDKQIEAVRREARSVIPVHVEPSDDLAYRLRTRDGAFVLTPLLAAKAQCLSAIANLKE